MKHRKRVYVVDDEASVRRSLEFLLRSAGYDPRSYASGEDFLLDADGVAPGCLLLDVRMPEVDGLEVQRRLADKDANLPVIMLTGHADVSIAVEAMKQGAVDFLEKPVARESLFAALAAAFERLDQMRSDLLSAKATVEQIRLLTTRERQVLRGLAEGMGNKTIARDLGISPRTVEVHRANVMGKLGARSLSDVLRLAFAAGIGL